MEKEIVCSFSGGRSSGMMIYILENHVKYRDFKKHYVFANTGREHLKTIQFVENVEKNFGIFIHLLESETQHGKRKSSTFEYIDRYEDLSMNGESYAEMIKKYGLPSIVYQHCTRELKIRPIDHFIKDYLKLKRGEYVKAIGMRYDEPRRIRTGGDMIYPLYNLGIRKNDVLDFWMDTERVHFDLDIREEEGNCDFCFKKSWSKLKIMAARYPEKLEWWTEMEEFGLAIEPGSEMYRGHLTTKDLLTDVQGDEESLDCACNYES